MSHLHATQRFAPPDDNGDLDGWICENCGYFQFAEETPIRDHEQNMDICEACAEKYAPHLLEEEEDDA